MEKQEEAYLKRKIVAKGGVCWKWTSGIRGVPDRIVLLPGRRIYFVETKYNGFSTSPAQKAVHKIIKALGWEVYLLKTREQIDQFLDAI